MSESRSRSRSPIREDSQDRTSEGNQDGQNFSVSSKRIYIKNCPSNWSYREVRQFVVRNTLSSRIADGIRYVRRKGDFSCVDFIDSDICAQAYNQLKNRKMVKGETKIVINWHKESPQISSKNNHPKSMRTTRAQASLNTYGLKQEFLDNLGVKLPILNKIFIANLDRQADEAKLREVFGIAGQIVDVIMITQHKDKTMAKIEYDHPLEAVQAISMFNGQALYGRSMAVQMDKTPNLHHKPLPAGLSSIGPGLGPEGTPMRSIRYTIEVEPLKDIINAELQKIVTLLKSNEQNVNQTAVGMMNSAMNMPVMTPLNINTVNALNQAAVVPVVNPYVNAQGMPNMEKLLLPQSDLSATIATLQAQANAQSVLGLEPSLSLVQNDMYSQAQSLLTMNLPQSNLNSAQWDSRSSIDKIKSSFDLSQNSYDNDRSSNFDNHSKKSDDRERTGDMLIFENLPSSVSQSALKSKMLEVGEIQFVKITDQGKAIVRFCLESDAQRCQKMFDRSKVDGQLIHVRYL